MRNKKNKSDANDFNDNKSGQGYPRRWGLLLNNPLVDSNIFGSKRNLWPRELEISGHEKGDPIWKPSNTNETVGRRRREMAENNKLSITRSIFELETPDFA